MQAKQTTRGQIGPVRCDDEGILTRLRHPTRRPAHGFTLIELMVALAVMALVAAVAIPIYTRYSVRTFRVEGQADLLGCAMGMERHSSLGFTYAGSVDTDANGIGDADLGAVTGNICTPRTTLYNITVTQADANNFTLRAAAVAATNAVGSDGIMEVDETGATRWDRNNDGDFGDANETEWTH